MNQALANEQYEQSLAQKKQVIVGPGCRISLVLFSFRIC